ncbi:DoxX family membrane protein [Streptomyces sp. NPDC001941]|uniref:DoxX family membrane protein n=1 Tax=Streptomyces sp. NPDC001941 TaxID=3154659 RepID=UPI0033252176
MSVDTRTPGTGFDDQPALSMVKVDCDPAQVIVNHASFRVQLAPSAAPRRTRPPVVGGPVRRRAPVVWSGRSAPGDSGASGLLQAVRTSTATGTLDAGATQVIPRIDLDTGYADYPDYGDDTMPTPVVVGPRSSEPPPLLPPMRRAESVDEEYAYARQAAYQEQEDEPEAARDDRRADADRAAAFYPDRRMNLGVVLLPLRVFLGFISIYAGMGKLCDPVYFDGGERGSMVKWLTSLHPWALAEPLRDFALSHPVGAGLTVAFAQVVVGVLTVLGLWQRVAAVFGTLLSAALILTVSWKTVPAYDAPDIIYLAAWSPLIIAGAPVYSIDARLSGEAWRTLGPRSELWQLRRRVLRRGALAAAIVVGLTLLIGSMLGGAVRNKEMVTVPGPNVDPTNQLPGQPLPQEPGARRATREATGKPKPSASAEGRKPKGAKSSSPAGAVRETGRVEDARPSATQGTGQRPPQHERPAPPPSSSAGPTSSGGSGGADDGSTGGGDDGGSSGGGGNNNHNPIGGLLG